MRIGSMAPQAAAALAVSRDQRRTSRSADAARQATPASENLVPQLPGAVADRLAGLMAADPGLAEAVSARLPAARLQSARDLAAYSTPSTPALIVDVKG